MMDVGPHSRKQVMETLALWSVQKDHADCMYNYLVRGFEPGSFFSAVLANDWRRAVQSCHPNNTVESLKAVTGWIYDCVPLLARGSPAAVRHWCNLSDTDRTQILLEHHIILSPKQETLLTLRGTSTTEPHPY